MSSRSCVRLYDQWIEGLHCNPQRPVARSFPDRTPLDVAEFERRVAEAQDRIHGAAASGVAARAFEATGGPVLLSVRNLPSYLIAIAALWKGGFVPLLADADLSMGEIADLVGTFRPALAILDRDAAPEGGRRVDLGPSLAGLHAWLPAPVRGGAGISGGSRRSPVDGRTDGGDAAGAAILRLTSGTTGRPRGLVVTADQLIADARNITGTMGIEPGDTMIAAIPLGHAYGFIHVLMALVLQGTRPLLIEQPLPSLLGEALSGPGPLVMAGTPYLFEMLLQASGPFPGLRLCLSAGAPLPERLSRAFMDRFGLPIRTFYGASECGGIAYDRSDPGIVPDGCVGTPLDGVRIDLETPPGAEAGIGRICVRSEAVVSGYLSPADEQATDAAPGDTILPGLFRTSDLGRLDGGGRLHLTGRIDRLINVGGRKVDPAEVEAVLRALPAVREAVVFGAPDRHRSQTVCACVVAAHGLTRDALLQACRTRLAPFKIPRRIEFVEAIPVTIRGKTDRRALARLLTSQRRDRPSPPRES